MGSIISAGVALRGRGGGATLARLRRHARGGGRRASRSPDAFTPGSWRRLGRAIVPAAVDRALGEAARIQPVGHARIVERDDDPQHSVGADMRVPFVEAGEAVDIVDGVETGIVDLELPVGPNGGHLGLDDQRLVGRDFIDGGQVDLARADAVAAHRLEDVDADAGLHLVLHGVEQVGDAAGQARHAIDPRDDFVERQPRLRRHGNEALYRERRIDRALPVYHAVTSEQRVGLRSNPGPVAAMASGRSALNRMSIPPSGSTAKPSSSSVSK
jgi:hypothetical protein